MVKGYEFCNSDGCTCCGMQEHESHMNLGADYVLASDYAALESRLAEVRMNTGCARGQHTTQFCAEVVARDKIITELLEMLRPLPKGDPSPYWKTYCEECGWFGLSSSCVVTHDEDHECLCPKCGFGVEEMHAGYECQIEARYARACKVAGRDE